MSNAVDHCAEAARLRARLAEIASGTAVSMIRSETDEVRYASANVDELKQLLAFHEDQCAAASGGPRRRRRYGIVGRARPY